MTLVGLVVPAADGGIAAHAASLLRLLPALGWQVRVCAPAAVLGQLIVRADQPAAEQPATGLVDGPPAVGLPAEQQQPTTGLMDGPPAVGLPGLPGTGLAGTGLAGTGLAGTGLAGTGLAGTGLAGTGLAGTGLAGVELVAVRLPAAAVAGALDPRAAVDLRAALAGVDVVSAQGVRAARASLGARPDGAGLLLTLHNPPPSAGMAGLLGTVALRRAARAASLVLGASADLVALARDAGARRAELLEVGAPPAGPPDPVRAAALRRELDPDRRGLVLAAGRLAPQKDHDLVLAALTRLPRERRPVVVIAGDGPRRAELAAAIAAAHLPVRLLGERADVPDLLGAADVALLCSRWEARSLFAQEALRAGVPLVATAVGGLPALVGAAAVLVPAGDPGALAAALERALHDDGLRARLAVAGPARAATWPTEDDTAAAVAAALGRVLLLPWHSVER